MPPNNTVTQPAVFCCKFESMPIRSWLTVPFLLLLSTSFAQTARLSGTVSNEKGEPVAGASIKIVGTTTNVEGVYFLNLSTGTKYTLEITAVGYTPKSIADVDVTTTDANELNVLLETASKLSDAIVVKATSTRLPGAGQVKC